MLEFFKQTFVNKQTPLILILMLLILGTVILSHLNKQPKKTMFSEQSFSDPSNLTLVNTPKAKSVSKSLPSAIKPDIAEILRIGIANWNVGELAKAEDSFRTVLLFQPKNPIALTYLTILYLHQARYADAEYVARLRSNYYPTDIGAQLQISSLYLHLEHYKQALVFAKKAFQLDPESGEAALNLAKIYARAGERGLMMYYLKLAFKKPVRPVREIIWNPAFDEYRNIPEIAQFFKEQEKGETLEARQQK